MKLKIHFNLISKAHFRFISSSKSLFSRKQTEINSVSTQDSLDLFVGNQERTLLDHINREKQSKNVIFLHALLGCHENWRLTTKLLANQSPIPLNIFSLDLRNHGKSPHSPIHTYSSMSQDLKKFILSMKLDKPILIGHSMGAKLAMYFALTQPHLIEKIIIFDASPTNYSHTHEHIFQALKQLSLESLTSIRDAQKILGKTITDPSERNYLLRNLVHSPSTNQFHWRINLEVLHEFQSHIMGFPEEDFDPFLPKCLFIGGTLSTRMNETNNLSIYKFFPNSKIEMLEAGHFVYAEKPTMCVDLINSFIMQSN